MKILIAEDENASRLLLETSLQRMGHEVVATRNGREAWTHFRKEPSPVLISDWMMPEIDGLMLCREVRKLARDGYTYFVLLTALGGKANYLEAIEAGVDDFLTKPFDAEQLGARLHVAERILGLRQHVRRLEGLLPICSYCKRIRDEAKEWNPIENYVARHAEVRFSHGICPECAAKVFG